MERAFLDANVLFSAAYRPRAGLLGLWRLAATTLVTSEYAANEALRNLDGPPQRARLVRLLADVEVVVIHPSRLEEAATLPEKDRPILEAAIAARCDVLITGDHRHFGHLFGATVCGVQVVTPSQFLERHQP